MKRFAFIGVCIGAIVCLIFAHPVSTAIAQATNIFLGTAFDTNGINGSNATDGNSATRAELTSGASLAIVVDLGSAYYLSSVDAELNASDPGGAFCSSSGIDYTIIAGNSCCSFHNIIGGTTIASLTNVVNCAPSFDTSSVATAYRYWQINIGKSGCSSCGFAIREFRGYDAGGAPTTTPTITNTPTKTPTLTGTPTRTITPTVTNTVPPTSTPINVIGNCGNPGQPPCHIYWLTPGPIYWETPGPVIVTGTVGVWVHNWPTVIPTVTPRLGVSAELTVIAITTGSGGAPPGVDGDVTGESGLVHSDYAIGGGMGGTDFIGYTQYDFGCPISAPAFGVEVCITYNEITSLNMGSIEIPLWPFLAALVLTVIAMIRGGR